MISVDLDELNKDEQFQTVWTRLQSFMSDRKDLISQHNYEQFYSEIRDTYPGLISFCSDIFYASGIDPLKYMKEVPAYFLQYCPEVSGELVIPDNIERIRALAFSGCSISAVDIGKSCEEIRTRAFEDCEQLKDLNILSDVLINIEEGAFLNCTSLKDVILPDSVTTIGDHCFQGCDSLENVYIPKEAINTGKSIFHQCYGIKHIIGPSSLFPAESANLMDSVQTITVNGGAYLYDREFAYFLNLRNIEIPTSIKKVGKEVFFGCDKLEFIRYAGTKAEWQRVALFDKWKVRSSLKYVMCADGRISV